MQSRDGILIFLLNILILHHYFFPPLRTLVEHESQITVVLSSSDTLQNAHTDENMFDPWCSSLMLRARQQSAVLVTLTSLLVLMSSMS